MIMTARPAVGDAFRPENVPGVVFEEVAVERVGVRVAGPSGPVAGAIVTREIHQDGSTERKLFAPGYGEFLTGSRGELEAMAMAVPVDGEMGRAVRALATAVRARRAHAARLAALDAATSGLDLRLRHRPPSEIDRGRFGLYPAAEKPVSTGVSRRRAGPSPGALRSGAGPRGRCRAGGTPGSAASGRCRSSGRGRSGACGWRR